MAIINVLPADPEDALYVVRNLREEDAFEVFSLGDPELVMKQLLAESREARIGYVDGIPACVFGLRRDTLMSDAILWLATTALVDRVPRTMARMSYDWVQSKLRQEGVLEGWVLERNKRSQRWLQWMGFTFGKPFHMEPVGMVIHFRKRL